MEQRNKILILNCGSSSVKYALFTKSEKQLTKGIISHVGEKGKTHHHAIQEILKQLLQKKYLHSYNEICAVGHRVVHGKDSTQSSIINKKILKKIKEASVLAPLHNPHNLEGISAIQKILPKIPNIAVFDTAFHTTIPEVAATYGIPQKVSKKYHIKRYGFHGISYQYICEERKKEQGKIPSRLIVCHLGNGSSITAIKNGKSVETSMGFTPMEGLLMGTRAGDIDVGAVFHIAKMQNECRSIDHLLNFESGLKGIAGTNDMRILWKKYFKNKNAKLAIDIYCHRLQKYIGAYTAILGGIDTIVFTAGIGENCPWIREKSCQGLEFLGIQLDKEKNWKNKAKISRGKVNVLVMKTNEEKMIAREVSRLV
ncbi:acetate/propionate family kinase [Candidatus Woesearchaeota archaeon]|nr:acetate/propionate family kinase [Candidatus Woesearchaeota archaeon]